MVVAMPPVMETVLSVIMATSTINGAMELVPRLWLWRGMVSPSAGGDGQHLHLY
jgi:hypothetical protein